MKAREIRTSRKAGTGKLIGQPSNEPLFIGWFTVIADENGRVRIPLGMRRQLEKNKVKVLWLGLSPGERALVLYPRGFWQGRIEKPEGGPRHEKGGELDERGIWPLQEVTWDAKGRIKLHELAQEHLAMKRGMHVVFRGRGNRFELWREEDLKEWEFGQQMAQ